MQDKSADNVPEYILLIVSISAATLWYLDVISEPVVAIITSLFGLLFAIIKIEIPFTDEKTKKNLIVFKRDLGLKNIIIIILFALLVIFILLNVKNEVTGIRGDNNQGNYIEIRD